MKKNDFILITLLVCFALALFYFLYSNQDKGSELIITVNGEAYGSYELTEDQIIKVNDSNIAVIHDSSVKMQDATCPDHLCIHQKAISKEGETIVCLPNRVVLQIMKGEETTLDAIVR